ncbi:Alpha,alpha-trehalose-phosphate synthase [UDP-forming] 5, partial [Cucurbita argyrosperma subsp. argyrosperma]
MVRKALIVRVLFSVSGVFEAPWFSFWVKFLEDLIMVSRSYSNLLELASGGCSPTFGLGREKKRLPRVATVAGVLSELDDDSPAPVKLGSMPRHAIGRLQDPSINRPIALSLGNSVPDFGTIENGMDRLASF